MEALSTPRRHELAMDDMRTQQAARRSAHEAAFTADVKAARAADTARLREGKQWLEELEVCRMDEVTRQSAFHEAQAKWDMEWQAAGKTVRGVLYRTHHAVLNALQNAVVVLRRPRCASAVGRPTGPRMRSDWRRRCEDRRSERRRSVVRRRSVGSSRRAWLRRWSGVMKQSERRSRNSGWRNGNT
jgi:hypothetical protein